ncbi:hypothetical protein COT78_04145 [Candidatus Berkelbacteria bacterium CG10_big_fil_rev_8_21_14_0_10_43_13]|uniref:Uncharacterized protein n=1 Tax=Candidatus Berkelbacteria bacterium CG10_big_fil_rev_8_21_14_0_10_43_13 TaxID=1974514 RepID=A0A2H0W7L4_9BACT|nr:MAG: hypothetical protein COT78_04145 [Candidatus Berkelbacteria bacterium CG10_big_fil_rev_8_21_14_0_10_43_13]
MENREEVQAALILHGPDGYRKTERYLVNTYGADLYNSIDMMRPPVLSRITGTGEAVSQSYFSQLNLHPDDHLMLYMYRLRLPSQQIKEKIFLYEKEMLRKTRSLKKIKGIIKNLIKSGNIEILENLAEVSQNQKMKDLILDSLAGVQRK